MLVCLCASISLTFLLSTIGEYVPLPSALFYVLNLPGVLYCHYQFSKPYPADDIPLYEAGLAIDCYYTGVMLMIPYLALLIFGAWGIVKRVRRVKLK